MYYKSAGYRGVMLLNASPDTTGKITEGDVNAYRLLGAEIERRFSIPIKQLTNKKGNEYTIPLKKPTSINHVVIEEDYHYGHRIRNYTVKGKINEEWKIIATGTSVGRKKIDAFTTQKVTAVNLHQQNIAGRYQHFPTLILLMRSDNNVFQNRGVI
jgi:alpha-L-fucosidase